MRLCKKASPNDHTAHTNRPAQLNTSEWLRAHTRCEFTLTQQQQSKKNINTTARQD